MKSLILLAIIEGHKKRHLTKHLICMRDMNNHKKEIPNAIGVKHATRRLRTALIIIGEQGAVHCSGRKRGHLWTERHFFVGYSPKKRRHKKERKPSRAICDSLSVSCLKFRCRLPTARTIGTGSWGGNRS